MLSIFRLVGYLEALSFLVLLGIAMPLKYMMGEPQAVRIVGMGHGILFIAYVILAIQVAIALEWPKKRIALALLASLLPGGAIAFDWKYLRSA